MRFVLAMCLVLVATPTLTRADEDIWGPWIEREFPFFSVVVDGRERGNERNMTPRAMVFHFGQTYVAWDVDLLRVSAIWTTDGPPFNERGMAVNSYPDKFQKVAAGQHDAPKPRGDVWVRNGIYPGATLGEPTFDDPRPPHPDAPDEVGRGGLPLDLGAFRGVRYDGTLEYEIGGVGVSERFEAGERGVTRVFRVDPHDKRLFFVLSKLTRDEPKVVLDPSGADAPGKLVDVNGHRMLVLDASSTKRELRVTYARDLKDVEPSPARRDRYWPKRVTREIPSFRHGDRVTTLEPIPLPTDNPWGRSVRVAAVEFLEGGRAVIVTFDGDVWIGEGLVADATSVTWRRFATGLHEPLNVAVRDRVVHVFDRNGLWALRDTNRDGEADYHELVCSQIDQTAETREFASDLRVTRDGAFVLCKPGQNHSTVGRSSGAVLRVSPDGRKVERLAFGLRQPFLGYDPKTDRIAVTDQQGNFVPTTPVHFLKEGAFYGFLGKRGSRYPQPITPPLTWIPHRICGSAAAVHWPRGEQLGPLDGACVLLAFTKPGLLQVFADETGDVPQGAATRIPVDPDFAPLKAAQNPADGMFYVAGFKVWGSKATQLTSLSRLRINRDKTWPLPLNVRATKRGVLLTFADPLDPEFALKPTRYDVDRWNYQRTPGYGSPHFKLDGSKGQDRLVVSSVKLSKDRRSVFIGLPDMLAAMQVRVEYDLRTDTGDKFKHEVALTAHRLHPVDLTTLGFADNDVKLTGGKLVAKVVKPTVEIGKSIYNTYGCAACHSTDGSKSGKTGPTWRGLYRAKRVLLNDGSTVVADEAYLRESIVAPTAKVAKGAVNGEAGMPAYAGVLSDEQIESLILFIKSLKESK